MKKLLAVSVLATSLLVGGTVPTFAKTAAPSVSAQKIQAARVQAVKSMNAIRATVASYKPTLNKFNPLKAHVDEMHQAFQESGLRYYLEQTNDEYYRVTEPVYSLNSYLSTEMVSLSQKHINDYVAKGNAAGVIAVENQFKKYASTTAKKLNYQGLVQINAKFEGVVRSNALNSAEYGLHSRDLTIIQQYYEENGALKANIDSIGFDIIAHARKPMMNFTQYSTMVTEVTSLRNQAKATSFDQINHDLTDWLVAKPRGLKFLNDLMPSHLQSEIDSLKKENDNLQALLANMQDLKTKYLGE